VKTSYSGTYPDISPDGKWLAYCSDDRGNREVYVQPYPGPGKAVPISNNGGSEPAWSREGTELFFTNQQKMMSVRFKISNGEFIPETPIPLFDLPLIIATTPVRSYDVSPDGHFLMLQRIEESEEERLRKIFPSELRIVLNWRTELDRLFKSKP
jgi:serine/threonine-protein kinase